jgi:hypothetical protein
MANTLLTISMITREALRVLKNELTFTSLVNRQYDSRFGKEGAKIGTTINVRIPPRYIGRTGQALQLENATETSKPVRLTTQFGVDISFSSQDLALHIDDFSKRFLRPAIATIANRIDYDGLQLYKTVGNSVGTPGTTPAVNSVFLDAGVKLDNLAAPRSSRQVVMNPAAHGAMVYGNQALFNPSAQLEKQYRTGQIAGRLLGFESWNMDQNVARHTVGTYAGTPLVNGANQTGASLITDGWTSTTLKRGDVFTIAGVNAVNPQSRVSTGQLQDFVVTADSTDSAGALTIPISPSIVTSGAFQTVTGSPADNAALTLKGTSATEYPQNLVFHEDAFVLATADLPLPGGVDMASRMSDEDTGLSIRLVRAYDINTDQFPCRLDVLYGWSELYTETACRVWG